MKKFKVKDVGEPFDGLIVYVEEEYWKFESEDGVWDHDADPVPILRVEKRYVLFDSFSLPLEPNTVYMAAECLVPFEDDEEDAQLIDNPYGEFVQEGSIEKDNIALKWVLYDDALTVNVVNGDNRLYSHNFMTPKKTVEVLAFLNRVIENGSYDNDDLVFDLRKLER